jgi:glycerophosphoryl diester phosphodiesterase
VPCASGELIALHSVDLNITTNVHVYNDGQFQSRARQSEANSNEWGYYVHDFTWDELQLLKVKQRVSDSGARSDAFDYMFPIPSFAQIVNLLYDWNTRELPLIGRDTRVNVPGMYVELKRSAFFEQDANVSIADLFLDELASHPHASELLFDHTTLCDGLKDDEYRVPPLVVQSFDGSVLEYIRGQFKRRWQEFVKTDAILADQGVTTNNNNDASTAQQDEINHPWIPPTILLVNNTTCKSTTFWSDISQYHVSGIGPDKSCLLPSESDITQNKYTNIETAKKTAKEWIAQAHSEKLAVHPWTIKLEMERQGQSGGVPTLFFSAEEEIRYYYCDLKVDGIFTENIAAALIVGSQGCNTETAPTSQWPMVGRKGGGPVCVEEESNLWFFGLAFMALGAFVGSILTCFVWSCASKGYFERALGTTRNRDSVPLPEVDTSLDEEDEGHDVL